MEHLGDMFEGEWASLSGMYTTTEESKFMTQLLGAFSPKPGFGGEHVDFFGAKSTFWPAQTSSNVASIVDEDSFVYSSDPSTSNVYFSQQETYTYSGSDGDITAQVCTDLMMFEDEELTLFKNSSMFEVDSDPIALHGTKLETKVIDDAAVEKVANKRPHNVETPKSKRNVKPRKSKKIAEITIVDKPKSGYGELLTQTSSSNYLKNDVSAPSEISADEFSNLTAEDSPPSSGKGKARANRGAATDPQSLYARKRREKINERLRILQGLVPNGTKVDISTMLDEAVQYVKFLQLQIKLLSSDDMWMYAPLAYNGMDLGLNI